MVIPDSASVTKPVTTPCCESLSNAAFIAELAVRVLAFIMISATTKSKILKNE